MKADQFEVTMREQEWYHETHIPNDIWIIIRVDGRSFTRLTEQVGFDKPFDKKFAAMMDVTADRLLKEMAGVYAYTQSDEISVLLPCNSDMFNRSHEKLVSVSAGFASSVFNAELIKYCHTMYPHFDGRLILAISVDKVVDYFRWRQADATRNCLNGYAYWILRQSGMSARQATKELVGKRPDYKYKLLQKAGKSFLDLPTWQRYGIGLSWQWYEKKGYNPKTHETVSVKRREIYSDYNLLYGQGYASMIDAIVHDSLKRR